MRAPSGERFTIYTAKAATETTQCATPPRQRRRASSGRPRRRYVVSGGSDRERLTQVARLVYDQSDKGGG